jgi:hypothetical protein
MNQFLDYGLALLAESGIVCEVDDFVHTFESFAKTRLDGYRYVKIISEADRGYISKL